jgi:hypothetical protein
VTVAPVVTTHGVPYGDTMKMRRPFRAQLTPETTSDLMSGFLSRLGGSGRALEFRVFEAWNQAVGDVFRARTMPDAFRGGTLFVRVSNSALGHEVTLLRGEILARIVSTLGPGIVTEIRTRVGAISSSSPSGSAVE